MRPILIILLSVFVVGCKHYPPDLPRYLTTYTYKNSSSYDITLSYYAVDEGWATNEPGNGPMQFHYREIVKDSIFSIKPNASHTIEFISADIEGRDPFDWNWARAQDSLVISNGEKQFVQLARNKNGLFDRNSYQTVRINGRPALQYTFTDQDFLNAQPIE